MSDQPDDDFAFDQEYSDQLDQEFANEPPSPLTPPRAVYDALAPLFPLPPGTPSSVSYSDIASTQFRENNFEPSKRQWRRQPSPQESDAVLVKTRNEVWKHNEWRGPQLEVCRAAMRGLDILVVAPTGLGKSLCFQLPAVTLEYGVTIVVCPLLALMGEQVQKLRDRGVKAAMLSSTCTQAEKRYVWDQLRMGHPELRLLYTTPESLFSHNNADAFQTAYRQGQVRRLVVDEAHVVDEWGVSFRPGYRDLSKFRQQNPDIPITALTASATAEVRADILNVLGITRATLFQRVLPVNRPNLFYEIRHRGSDNNHSKSRAAAISEIIHQYRPEAKQRNAQAGISPVAVSGLVYCRSRTTCEDVASALSKQGIRARPFHAGLREEVKKELLEKWLAGTIECVVATIAFGMGVDHPHVRYVIHYDMPKSFEGYYQETGRAGRDQKMSRCILLYSREDAQRQRNLVQNEVEAAARKMEAGLNEDHIKENKQRAIDSFKLLQHFAESTICRHLQICRYFGENVDPDDPEAVLQNCEKMCDICCKRGAVLRRAQVLTENIDIASQVIRPKKVIKSQPSLPPVSSSGGMPNSLALLHGSVSTIRSDPLEVEIVDPRPRKKSRVEKPLSAPKKRSQGEDPGLKIGNTDVRKGKVPAVKAGADVGAISKKKKGDMGPPKSTLSRSKAMSKRAASPEASTERVEDEVLEPARTPLFGRNATAGPGPGHPPNMGSPKSTLSRSRATSKRAASPEVSTERDERVIFKPARTPLFGKNATAGPGPGGPSSSPEAAGHAESTQRRASAPPVETMNIDQSASSRSVSSRSRATGKRIHKDTPAPRTRSDSPHPPITPIRSHPPATHASTSRRPGTIDDYAPNDDGGGYATAERLPLDPKKRVDQEKKFLAIESIKGKGPFPYYQNGAAVNISQKRAVGTFKTPFNVPLPKETTQQVGEMSGDDRRVGLSVLQKELKKTFREGEVCDAIWEWWGRDEAGEDRSVLLKRVGKELEVEVVKAVEGVEGYNQAINGWATAIRTLRARESVHIVTNGELELNFQDDEMGKQWISLKKIVRRVRL